MEKDNDAMIFIEEYYDGGISYIRDSPVSDSEIEEARRILSEHVPFGIEQFRGTYEE